MFTIVQVVVSMMLKIENNNYSETPPEVAVLKVFLMMTSTLKNIWLRASNIQPNVESLFYVIW